MSKSFSLKPDARKGKKRLSLLDGEGVFVGLDVHKESFHAAFWAETQERVLTSFVMPADVQGVVRMLKPLKSRVRHVAYEAGPTGYALVRALRAAGFGADVIAPGAMPRPAVRTGKSDSVDAKKLAELDAKGLLRPVAIPTEQEDADRALARTRGQIVRNLRRAKHHIKGFLLYHGIAEPDGLKHWASRGVEALRSLEIRDELRDALDLLLDDYSHVCAQLKKVDARLRALAGKPRHCSHIKRLRTAPGVGPVTAMTFRLELLHPERFDSTNEVAQMIGLAPCVRASGQEKIDAGLSPGGNRRLRTALIEAAWTAVRDREEVRARYRRLVANTGKANKAIAGVARWLGIVLWKMLVNKEDYRVPVAA